MHSVTRLDNTDFEGYNLKNTEIKIPTPFVFKMAKIWWSMHSIVVLRLHNWHIDYYYNDCLKKCKPTTDLTISHRQTFLMLMIGSVHG
ncbi:unnamed protein product [Blepharisma stoltei]|uniref:Uncharacterized protein n=1 Tax=Blepharisma stoltei TaxID=1481888 RepID=A0AAU9IVX0_9CILI|nr:unnamed protein product [Blepharisma stoltei]